MTTPVVSAPPSSPVTRPAIGLLAGLGVAMLIIAIGTVLVIATMHGDGYPQVVVLTQSGLVTLLVANAIGAFCGGFVTARITAGRSMYTTFVLALVLFMSAMVPALRGADLAAPRPRWFLVTLAVVLLVASLVGGFLERRRDATQ